MRSRGTRVGRAAFEREVEIELNPLWGKSETALRAAAGKPAFDFAKCGGDGVTEHLHGAMITEPEVGKNHLPSQPSKR